MNSDAVNCRPEQVFRLVVTGGGTGGHTYSALTAVRTLQARLADAGRALDVLWVGSAYGPDVPSPAAIAELTALGKAAVFVPPASSVEATNRPTTPGTFRRPAPRSPCSAR